MKQLGGRVSLAPDRTRQKRIFFLACYAAIFLLFLIHRDDYLSIEALKARHLQLKHFFNSYTLAPFLYMGVFAVLVACSLPVALIFTLTAGLIFPQPSATLYSCSGATAGACILYILARSCMRDMLQDFARRTLGRSFLEQHASSANNILPYICFVRLVPGFPFFLANLIPVVFDVPFIPYAAITFCGLLPAQYIFTQIGAGLDVLFSADQEFSWSVVLTDELKVTIVALTILSFVPLVLKHMRARASPNIGGPGARSPSASSISRVVSGGVLSV